MSRYDVTDFEWRVIEPLLPNKPRGVLRVDDRRILNGILWVLRSGAPWRDLPDDYGPHTTCYNRFVRWRRAGVWDQIMEALAAAHGAAVLVIDTSVVRAREQWCWRTVATMPTGSESSSTSKVRGPTYPRR